MGTEIERKFLVKGNEWRIGASKIFIRQGYLSIDKYRVVRIRVSGNQACITIKGLTHHATRSEFEYPIPVEDGEYLLNQLCVTPLIEKYRYTIVSEESEWTVDEFRGDNEGLILAEIELFSEEDTIRFPDWVGEEVTDDVRYFNSQLIQKPFKEWNE